MIFGYLILFCCLIYTAVSDGITSESESSKKVEVFCVTSSSSSSTAAGNEVVPCQGHNSSEHHTLAYYMNHSSEYFKS